jgi:hypothetical protein
VVITTAFNRRPIGMKGPELCDRQEHRGGRASVVHSRSRYAPAIVTHHLHQIRGSGRC